MRPIRGTRLTTAASPATIFEDPDGSTYVAPVWPGPSVFPDFTRAETRAWWGGLYKDFVADGISGFWNDMNEPAIFETPTKTMPLDVVHRIDEPGFSKRNASHAEIHNLYGMENTRATYEGLQQLAPDERPFVLTRASYAGGQRYAATWTGDNTASWNHLRLSVPMLLNLGLSGFAYSGADVGGFEGSPNADLLTRWLEVAAFTPFYRNHTNNGSLHREPWVDGPAQEAIRRHYIEERYRLLPGGGCFGRRKRAHGFATDAAGLFGIPRSLERKGRFRFRIFARRSPTDCTAAVWQVARTL